MGYPVKCYDTAGLPFSFRVPQISHMGVLAISSLGFVICQAITAKLVVQEIFDAADTDGNGLLTCKDVASAMQKASKEYSHLEEYSRYLDK